MEEKKMKDEEAKRRRLEQDMVDEARYKEEVERERQMIQQEKSKKASS